MSLRKIAGLLAASGLAIGLIGGGVGAQFTASVTGQQNINVGTFGCQVVAGDGYVTDGSSITYNAPSILSSAPGSSPFHFVVKSTGTIPAYMKITAGPVLGTNSSPFSTIAYNPPVVVGPVAGGTTQNFDAGLQWTELDNTQLGQPYSIVYSVSCSDTNTAEVIFDNTPAVTPGNLPSYGEQAYSFNEWGGGTTFAGTARKLSTASVILSSWACEAGGVYSSDCVSTPGDTYSVPITFTVYSVSGGVVGSPIATTTQTFAIPYRPTHALSTQCSGDMTAWTDGTNCFHGKAVKVTFTFAGQVLPSTAVFGITYKTLSSGYPALGVGSPTDSLNIAGYPGTNVATLASVGTWAPNDVSGYVVPRTGSTMVGQSPVTNMPTGAGDNFVGLEPAVQITATN